MAGTQPNYTAVRTLRALERLAFQPMSAPELGVALGVHARTARRMMQALATEQYVQREVVGGRPSRRWGATPRLLALAAHLSQRLPLVAEDTALVRQLAVSKRSAWLCMPAHGDGLVLCSCGADAPAPWTLLPAVDCLAGTVLLAHRSSWRRALNECRAQMSEAHAERIRRAGYAMKYTAERITVAVPILVNDDPIAAVTVTCPAGEPEGPWSAAWCRSR